MSNSLYVRKGFGHGAATSCGKLMGRVGFKQRRLAPGEVTDKQLSAEIDAGWRHFFSRRMMKGIFPHDNDGEFHARMRRQVA